MNLDLFNIEKFIDANHCPLVTNNVAFNSDGTPTSDGIFSYELFGTTDEERKNTFGYIDLKGYYLHPIVYLTLTKRMKSIGDIVMGQKYAVLENKRIQIVPKETPGAATGLKFLYDNFENIEWIDDSEENDMDSIDKKTRLKFLKSLKKDEAFVKYWLVLPPFYRAESSSNRSMGDSINKLYKELLAQIKGMNLGYSFDIFGDGARARIQVLIKELYLTTLAPVSGKNLLLVKGQSEGDLVGTGKNSLIRRHLVGKNIDWGTLNVVTSPISSEANDPEAKQVRFGEGLFPIASLLSSFQPFYLKNACDFLEDFLIQFQNDYRNEIEKINTAQFTPDVIERAIKRFIISTDTRFDPIPFYFVAKDGQEHVSYIPILEFTKKEDALKNINYRRRPFTYMDLFYQITKSEIQPTKHVYVTRYPVTNFQNMYPSRIKVATTNKVNHLWIKYVIKKDNNDDRIVEFIDYPTIPYKGDRNPIDAEIIDVFRCGNAHIASMNADYDGDTLFLASVFSQEANYEAEEKIWAKSNFFSANGKLSRGIKSIGKDCILGLYEYTKDGN